MNAIILAAGLGSRFKEMTENKHKSLLEINGKPNLERTIQYLIEADIKEIIIVVGYLKESFKYLTKKYKEVKLIENPKFKEFNNMYSFYLARDYLRDSFIIESDVVLVENIFKNFKSNYSTYFTVIRKITGFEWVPILDENLFVKDMIITDEKLPSISGVSFWKEKDFDKIINRTNYYYENGKFSDEKLYWDNIVIDLYEDINIECRKLSSDIIFEMDNKEDYKFINNILEKSKK